MNGELKEHFSDNIRTIDPDNWSNIYVVGDVHGCSEEFMELIDYIGLQDCELLICVGDIIRKGPDSAGALEIVRNNHNILSVLGNGEVKYLAGEVNVNNLDDSHHKFIKSWPLIITWPGNAVVHGGFDPEQDIEDHSVRDVVNMRSPRNDNHYQTPFWFDEFEDDTRVFFGHTVTHEPIRQDNAVALDTGCVYGGKLTAYDTQQDDFVNVDAKKVYLSRDENMYADTQRINSQPTASVSARASSSSSL